MPAQLEILLTDNGGPAPVGGAAPAGSGAQVVPPTAAASVAPASVPHVLESSSLPSGAKPKEPEIATLGEGMTALARVGGFGAIVSATQMLLDGISQLKAAQGASSTPASAGTPTSAPQQSGGKSKAQSPEEKFEELYNLFPVEAAPTAAAPAAGEATGMAATAAGLAEMAGPIAITVAALAGLGVAAKKVTDAMLEDAHKLAEFSAELSASEAQATLRQQLAEIDRADRNGEALARFNDVNSRIQTSIYEGITAIENLLANLITPMLEEFLPLIKVSADALQLIVDAIVGILNALTGHLPTAGKYLSKISDDLVKMANDILDPGGDFDPFAPDPFTESIMNSLPGYQGPQNVGEMDNQRQAFGQSAAAGNAIGGAAVGGILGGILNGARGGI